MIIRPLGISGAYRVTRSPAATSVASSTSGTGPTCWPGDRCRLVRAPGERVTSRGRVRYADPLRRGCLRGRPKYVTCVQGRVADVVVDIRVGSPTFGRWIPIELDARSKSAVLIGEGLGHGFQALTQDATIMYLLSHRYEPSVEHGINPLCPTLAIRWPIPDRSSPSGTGRRRVCLRPRRRGCCRCSCRSVRRFGRRFAGFHRSDHIPRRADRSLRNLRSGSTRSRTAANSAARGYIARNVSGAMQGVLGQVDPPAGRSHVRVHRVQQGAESRHIGGYVQCQGPAPHQGEGDRTRAFGPEPLEDRQEDRAASGRNCSSTLRMTSS